jgi:hypothetical protein
VHEDPSEIVRVLLDPVIEHSNLLLVEETQYALLELTASLAGDDLHEPYLLLDRFIDDPSKSTVDIVASVIDLMEIQLQLHDNGLHRARAISGPELRLGARIRRDRSP